MNRRLYFILPDVEISRKVEDDLLLSRITEHQMHFLGKRGTDMKDLPEASQIQKTDIIHGFQIGMFAGALGGAIMGLIAYLMRDIIGMQLQLGIILLLFLVGGVSGALISGLFIGSSTQWTKDISYSWSMLPKTELTKSEKSFINIFLRLKIMVKTTQFRLSHNYTL